jgi:hypothetical protein
MNMKISGLTITTAVAIYAAASPAKALTLTMACEGYNVVFSPSSLMSHAPTKDRDYPITKVDVQNDRIVVTGVTKYGKITAFFSNDGHPSVVWTNGKDVYLQESNTRLREENTRLQQEAKTKAAIQDPYRPTVTCADGFDIFGEYREGMCSNHGCVKQSSTPVATLGTAGRADNSNVDEAGFISVINDARSEYNNGSNDMAKGAARVNRRDHLCQLVKSMAVRGWTGTIAELSSSSSGKGVLVVSIGPKITIRTSNNEISDSINHTLLSPSSNVFRQAVSLSKDQRIVFSGSFLPGDTDCVQETSLTQEGSMTDPEAQFLFTDVRAP